LFLYPDEGVSFCFIVHEIIVSFTSLLILLLQQFEGSRRTFAALHKKMLEMDKVAICYLVKRDNSLPSFVALKAQVIQLKINIFILLV